MYHSWPSTSVGLDLEVGDRGLQLAVPVDQPLVLVDQALAVEVDEHLADRLREALVEGEAVARPVGRGAEPMELAADRAAGFLLPRPDPLDEGRAAELTAARCPRCASWRSTTIWVAMPA